MRPNKRWRKPPPYALTHGYFNVDLHVVREIATADGPALVDHLRAII